MLRICSIIAAVLLPVIMAASCPTPDEPLPQRLHAPQPSQPVLTGAKISGQIRVAVHVNWSPSTSDSIRTTSYTIIRKTSTESAFSVPPFGSGIPISITDFYDDMRAIEFPISMPYKTIYYCVFSVDSLNRHGDTSSICSLKVAWPPRIAYPIEGDTLDSLCFSWKIWDIQGPFRSNMALWNDSEKIYDQPLPQNPSYGTESSEIPLRNCIPDSLYPLPKGNYFFATKVVITDNDRIESMNIVPFYCR